MSDVVDAASEQQQHYLNQCMELQADRAASHKGPTPIGVCHNCDEDVTGPRLFCDGQCAAEWEKIRNR